MKVISAKSRRLLRRKFASWSRPKRLFTIAGVAAIIVMAFQFLGVVLEAYMHASTVSGYPANGAFQLFNPLRRLFDGQIPGHDFQVFHGIGTVLAHVPLYWLFGQDLLASELSRFLTSAIIFVLVSYFFLYALTKRWQWAAIGTALMLGVSTVAFYALAYPDNSMLGVRSATPLILGAVIAMLPIPTAKKLLRWEIIAAILLALCLFVGTEHGLSVLAGFSVIYVLFFPVLTGFWTRVWHLLRIWGLYAAATCLLFMASSGIHFLEPIKYALVEVPTDQFWYFGAPPNPFVTTIGGFFVSRYITISLIIGVLTLGLVAFTYRRERTMQGFAMLVMMAYALVSNVTLLGYYRPAYAQPMLRVSALVILWLIWHHRHLFVDLVHRLWHTLNGVWRHVGAATVAVVVVIVAGIVVMQFGSNLHYQFLDLSLLEQGTHNPRMGAYLNPTWELAFEPVEKAVGSASTTSAYPKNDSSWSNGIARKYGGFLAVDGDDNRQELQVGRELFFTSGPRHITKAEVIGGWIDVRVDGPTLLDPKRDGFPQPIYFDKKPDGKLSVWAVYAGLLEAENDTFPPSGYGYIIHALGPERRRQYVEKFDATKPEYVTTLRRGFFSYEEWLQNSHWDFYERLLTNYDVKASALYNLVWQKREGDWKKPGDDWQTLPTQRFSDREATIPIQANPDKKVTLYSVRLSYQIQNPFQFIPYVGKLPRYLISTNGLWATIPVSLPPYEASFSFPVVAYEDRPIKLNANTASLTPGSNFKITKVEYRPVDISDESLSHFLDVEEAALK